MKELTPRTTKSAVRQCFEGTGKTGKVSNASMDGEVICFAKAMLEHHVGFSVMYISGLPQPRL